MLNDVGRDELSSRHLAEGLKDARVIDPFGDERLDEIFLGSHAINYAHIQGRSPLGAP